MLGELSQSTSALRRVEEDLNAALSDRDEFEEESDRLRRRLPRLEREHNELEDAMRLEMDELASKLAAMSKARDDLEKDMIEQSDGLYKALGSSREDLQRELNEGKKLLAQREAELKRLTADFSLKEHALESEREALATELDRLIHKVPALELTAAELEAERAELREKLDDLIANRDQLAANLRTENDSMSAELSMTREALDEQFNAVTTQLLETDEIIDKMRKDNEAAKEAAENDRLALQGELERVVSESNKLRAAQATAESLLRAERDDLEDKVEKLESLRREHETKLNDVRESATQQRADLESQLREREEDIERVRSELDESKAALESERDALQSELERVMDDVLNAEALAEQAELIRSQMQADMEQLLEARQSVEQRLQDVDSALQISLNKVATLEIEQERLRLELSASEKALAESERARSESDAEILALSDELSDALNARLLIEQQLRARDEELETARIKQSELITENSKLRAELMDAKAMADDYTRQLSSGLFGDEKRVEAGIQRFDSFEASDTGIFATDEADEAFVTACNMVQRIEILVRRQKQTGEELKRLDDTGAAESDDARLLRSELAAMGSQLDSCRETLAACSHGLSVLESRMAEEFAAMGKSPMFAEGMDTTRSRVRDLEKSLAAANAQSDVTFKNLQIALDASTMDVGRDIPVEFKIPFQSIPGQRILVVGTWCDWITQNGLQLTWTEGNIWKGTMTLHTGSNYEYKYVVVEEVLGGVPGEAPPYFPPWGTTEPKIEQMFDGRAYMLVWQPGNNKAMALDNIHTDGVAQIKVSDDWIANPKKSPITLFAADGEVLEIVGSTALLGETVDRADHALAEARKQVQMMADLASAALAEVDTQLARRIATQLDDIRHKGTLSTDSDGKHHRGTKALPSSVEAGSPRSNLNWMNIGFGLEAQDDGEDSTSASTDAEDAGDGIDYA